MWFRFRVSRRETAYFVSRRVSRRALIPFRVSHRVSRAIVRQKAPCVLLELRVTRELAGIRCRD